MPFDFAPEPEKCRAGRQAYLNGLAAEDVACRAYRARGFALVAQRWRGRCGEIDLIFDGPDELVFVEVKKARTHDDAKARLSQRQLERIAHSASDYIATETDTPLRPMRLDLAMVDDTGAVATLENLTLY